MKKIFLKNWLAASVSLLLAGSGIIWACADGDWFSYGSSNFTPEAFVAPKYNSFFYSYQQYYDIGYDNKQTYRFEEDNVRDWQKYLGNHIDKKSISDLLYNTDQSTIDSLNSYLKNTSGIFPHTLTAFSWTKNKKDKKLNQFIGYLSFAKHAEGYATQSAPSWYEKDKDAVNMNDYSTLKAKLITGFNSADEFVKERYWFQIIRYYFFNNNSHEAIDFFNQYKNQFDKNTMYYRCMSYAAGAHYKLKDFSKANYLYSLVFAHCDALKTTAHYSFHPQEEKDWQATLALAKTKEEKITLWQMLGIFYADEKRSIKEIYQLDPSNEKIDLLLVRAINKLEQEPNALLPYRDYLQTKENPQTDGLLKLITNEINPQKTNNPFLFTIAAGYICMLRGNKNSAQQYINKASTLVGNNELQQWQLRLLEAVNYSASTPIIDKNFEQKILKDLVWLKGFKFQENEFRHSDAFEFIKQDMATKYKKQGEKIKSELFVNNIDFFGDDASVDNLIAFLNKKNKTDFEKIAKELYIYKTQDLYEYKAIRAAFNDKIDDAIAFMEKAPDAAEHHLLANPFNGYIADCHDCEFEKFKGKAYTKLSFLKKLKEMESNIRSGTNMYDNALLVANAFYNMSHYGNARAFSESGIIANTSTPHNIDSVFKRTLTNMKTAKSYYQKAFEAATNNEQRAKCTYMLAKCERNDWYNKNIYFNPFDKRDHWEYDGILNIADMSYFKKLKQDYATTQYYKEAIKECGYLKTYSLKY